MYGDMLKGLVSGLLATGIFIGFGICGLICLFWWLIGSHISIGWH